MNPETIEINGEIAYKYLYNGNYYITKSGNLYSTYIICGQGKTDINLIPQNLNSNLFPKARKYGIIEA